MLKLLRHNTAHVCLFFFSPGATFGCFAFNFPPRLAWDLALHLGEKGKKNKTSAKKEKSMGEASRRGSLGRGKGKGGTAEAPPLPFPLPQATAGLASLADIFPN